MSLENSLRRDLWVSAQAVCQPTVALLCIQHGGVGAAEPTLREEEPQAVSSNWVGRKLPSLPKVF